MIGKMVPGGLSTRTRLMILSLVVVSLVGVAVVATTFAIWGVPEILLPWWEKAVAQLSPQGVMKLLMKGGAVSLLTGFVTRWLQNRKERFVNGMVEYALHQDYILIIGYDFQAGPLVKRLLSSAATRQILLITNRDVRTIRATMSTELTADENERLLYMRRDLALDETYSRLRIRGADMVFVLGDEGVPGRDGIVLRVADILAEKAASEPKMDYSGAVKVYLHFDDPGIYSQMRSQELSLDRKDLDGETLFDLEVFNYYDSWVWKCWSEKDSDDGDSPYLPLRFKADSENVELFVVGSGKVVKAVVDSAITLMNYGEDTKKCRLTVVSDQLAGILPPEDAIAVFPELEVLEYPVRDFNRKVAVKMLEAASNDKCSVTVVIAEDEPEKAVKTYLSLPFALRNQKISVLLWMGTVSRNITEKRLIKVGGDNAELRYFGMTDRLPWLECGRNAVGADVNFYYSIHRELPLGTDTSLVEKAKALWNEAQAVGEWNASKRWKKWSSINSCGSFKEKSAMIAGRKLTPELQLKLLKAEHNRWWTERLLGDWRVGERDDARRIHPNLVSFEELDDFTKDIDKICIASMVRQGYVG